MTPESDLGDARAPGRTGAAVPHCAPGRGRRMLALAMRTTLRLLLAFALLAPALARAQASASVQLELGLPVVLPPMVVVQPGIQVVPDQEEEVFFYNGWYWVRRDDGWYRSRSHRHGWYFVRGERVPRKLVALPPGQYRRWHAPPPGPRPGPARYHPAPPPRYEPAPARRYTEPQPERRPGHGDRDEGRGRGHEHHDNGRHEGW